MKIFDRMKNRGHEQLIFCLNKPTGLRAIIAIHDTTLGTSVGGTRLMEYEREEDAVIDALRLSEISTFQSASFDSDMGGGAAVLMTREGQETDEAYFRAFGRFVEGLKGLFVAYPALGTTDRDFRYVRRETSSIVPMEGSHEITAVGVLWGMKACVRELTGSSSLKDLHVAVQGVGDVGQLLVDELVQDRHPDVEIVRPDEILGLDCFVLSPCAVGRVLNDETIPKLKCKVVAGAASDLLEAARHADALKERGILYAPDFVIGGAELYQTEPEFADAPRERLFEEARRVYDVVAEIVTRAKKEGTTPYRIAVAAAARRVGRIRMVRNIMC